jgi:hypothetical protein
MKLHKIKDSVAVGWFIIIIILLYYKNNKVVIGLLTIGLLGDLFISLTDIGDTEISWPYRRT